MEKEKVVWAGFGILSMVALVCLQRPSISSSRDRRSRRLSRADRTNSRHRHSTSSPLTPTPATNRRLTMTAVKNDRSCGNTTSKRDGSVGRSSSTNGMHVARSHPDAHSPRELHAGETTVVKELPHVLGHAHAISDVQHTARHKTKEPQTFSNNADGSAKKHHPPIMEERATQTESYTWEELRRMEAALLSTQHNNRPNDGGGEALDCISPIPFQDGDDASPLSSMAIYASPMRLRKEMTVVLLPPSLQRGVEAELVRLVDAVRQTDAGPHVWFSLFTFLTDLPRCVLRHVVATKGIDLSPSVPTTIGGSSSTTTTTTTTSNNTNNNTPLVTAVAAAAGSSSSSNAMLDSNSVVHFSRLQREVCRLVRGEASQETKIGRFKLSDDEMKVLWSPLKEKGDKKTGRFSHFSVFSSDEEEVGGGDDDDNDNDDDYDDDNKVKVAEIVEGILLKRRQERMISESTQFPEGVIPQTENHIESTQVQITTPTTTFDETDVMGLLSKLVKLKHHTGFSALQRNCADVSFSVDIVDLTNEAQRLLDRAAIRSVAATTITPTPTTTTVIPSSTAHIPSTSQESQRMSWTQQSFGQREQWNNQPLSLTPPETRHMALKNGKNTLRFSSHVSQDQDDSNSTNMNRIVSKKEEQRSGQYSLEERIDSIYRLCEPQENAAATPPRNKAPESFARNLTTTTIPSTLTDESERQRLLFGRSQTQATVEMQTVSSNGTTPTTGARKKFTVYDRLYTPPKGVAKTAPQSPPPNSGRSKPPFNVYV